MQSWEERIMIKQEGIAEGRIEGEKALLKSLIKKKMAKKYSAEQISAMLEVDVSEVVNKKYRTKSICKKLLVAGSVGSSFILMHGHIIRTVRYVYQDMSDRFSYSRG